MQQKGVQRDGHRPVQLSRNKGICTLKNGSKWPFGINEVSVGLAKTRKNANYGVDVYVKSYTGGRLGDITVSGKLTNGFKLKHDGSAQTVVVVVRVTGGMN